MAHIYLDSQINVSILGSFEVLYKIEDIRSPNANESELRRNLICDRLISYEHTNDAVYLISNAFWFSKPRGQKDYRLFLFSFLELISFVLAVTNIFIVGLLFICGKCFHNGGLCPPCCSCVYYYIDIIVSKRGGNIKGTYKKHKSKSNWRRKIKLVDLFLSLYLSVCV